MTSGIGTAFGPVGSNGFENQYNDYLERQQQNPYPYPPYPSPYNQDMNYLPMPGKDIQKSKSTQHEMLIRSLSLKK